MVEMSLKTPIDMIVSAAVGGNLQFTGRQIITFKKGATNEGAARLKFSESTQIARSLDFRAQAVNPFDLDAQALVYSELGVAITTTPPDAQGAIAAIAAEGDGPIASIEPETLVFSTADVGEYLRGFAAAVDRIRQDLTGGAPVSAPPAGLAAPLRAATEVATLGLQQTGVLQSMSVGRGIKVAMLDTGLDFNHPDFLGRSIQKQSFAGQTTAQDGNGHGTHTTGTACGLLKPANVPRYGIAAEAEIFVGKVLNDAGISVSGSVLAGMNWAIANRCEVISMSLAGPGGPFNYYTQAGQAALDAGCLIVAAAGNQSRRPAFIAPTGSPANSPTIVSVAAVDEDLEPAFFSNGGKVDIAGPGTNVFSSYLMPQGYATLSGTSMATPHVAGVAALLAATSPGLRGARLWAELLRLARPLPFSPSDVGAGLVQAVSP